ncbi:hypothetical protein NE848_10415 [Gramella jeungdoensis]|uniref:DUF3592 domain-containing protein n=1 Tax=Gramella jeungdoensis TaxID=708091 RepID=A0ABT0Z240_9FLAO|nr:hypothetical protein [Gramella jeungdoensis]MCM8569795.1 hypothetical protein [Gramella jeungdoensis]
MISNKPIHNFISLFLIVLLLFQSCTIYYNQNYSPEEVVKSEKKIRLTDRNGEKYPFYKLIRENGNYYVLAKNSPFFTNKFKNREKADLRIPGFSAYQIDPEDYKVFQIKNTSGSAWATISLGVIAMGILVWIMVKAWEDAWDWGAE